MPDELTSEEQAFLDAEKATPTEVAETAAPEPDAPVSEPAQPEPEAPKAEKPPAGFVPHGALHAEREERKAAEAREAALMARIEALEKATAKPAEPEVVPDPILAPDEFANWQRGEHQKTRDAFEAWRQEQAQAQQAQARMMDVVQQERAFMETQADYPQALEHLIASRRAEMAMMGYGEAQIGEMIAREANAIFDNAKAAGKNAAGVFYDLAKGRGYKAPKAEGPTEAERMKALREAQEETTTLAKSAGRPQGGDLTYEQIANMSEAQLRKVPKDKLDRALGKAM